MNLIYHRNKCIGCNACFVISPAFWAMNKTDGKVDLIESVEKRKNFLRKIWNDEISLSKEFENSCPTNAIKVTN